MYVWTDHIVIDQRDCEESSQSQCCCTRFLRPKTSVRWCAVRCCWLVVIYILYLIDHSSHLSIQQRRWQRIYLTKNITTQFNWVGGFFRSFFCHYFKIAESRIWKEKQKTHVTHLQKDKQMLDVFFAALKNHISPRLSCSTRSCAKIKFWCSICIQPVLFTIHSLKTTDITTTTGIEKLKQKINTRPSPRQISN